MHLERNKTDKKDAGWICRYAIDQRPTYWQMPDSAYFESKQLYNTIRDYTEQIKRINNQLHSLRLLPVPSKDTEGPITPSRRCRFNTARSVTSL